MKPNASPLPLVLFAVTLFTSALLLFLIQPMIGKAILPRFGGTASVWATCMVFFQAILLAGYAYAHHLTNRLPVARQAAFHSILLLLPLLAFLVFPVGWADGPDVSETLHPALGTLLLLFVLVGLPAFVVCTSAPLLQRWFADTGHPAARDPYFLYAASNLGSMISLLSYPVLIEPQLALPHQGTVWMVGYVLLVGLTLGCARLVGRRETPLAAAPAEAATEEAMPSAPPPSTGQQLRWLFLAFVPSSLVLGVTTHFTTDIAAVPLLWLAPLTLYLLSFIIVFSQTTAFLVRWMVEALPVLVLILAFLALSETDVWIGWLFLIHLATLLAAATVCHGELARDRPPPAHLTRFYLCMSVGGVLGGLFNALLAPAIFNDVAEYYLVLVLACVCLPRLEPEVKSAATRWFEIGLAALLGLGALWVWVQYLNDWQRGGNALEHLRQVLSMPMLKVSGWTLGALALVLMYVLRAPRDQRGPRLLDLLLPLALGLLAVRCVQKSPLEDVSLAWFQNVIPVDHYRLVAVITGTLLVALAYVYAGQPLRFALCVGALFLATVPVADRATLLYKERNFFGVSKVEAVREKGQVVHHRLYHGTTMHGQQRRDGEPLVLGAWLSCLANDGTLSAVAQLALAQDTARDVRNQPVAYFHQNGPVGQLFGALIHATADRRPIGVIGLGTGTLCGYVLHGQPITFYDIDPLMVAIATNPAYFTFLQDCRGKPSIVMGDGRLRLAQAADGAYRMIIVDAFSSDAIPIHLLTREAVQLYFDKLTPDGALVVHISNRYLRLGPVLGNIAADLGLTAVHMHDAPDDDGREKLASHWVVLARKAEDLGPLGTGGMPADNVIAADALLGMVGSPLTLPGINARYQEWHWVPPDPKKSLWTDKYSNLLSTLVD